MKTKRTGKLSNKIFCLILAIVMLFAMSMQIALAYEEGPLIDYDFIPETGEVIIGFTTVGDSTNMRCDFTGTAAVWYWADGTTTSAVSGTSFTKSGLGDGVHQNYLTISNGSGLTRFGAGNAGQGHIVTISGLQSCPNMEILYAYQENSLTSIGDTSTTAVREYHLMGTSITAEELDGIFADAVGSEVEFGTLWADTSGTTASDNDKAALEYDGWALNIPAWQSQTPTLPPSADEARIDFITNGNLTNMRCDFAQTATAVWHWSDGTTTAAV